MFDALSEKLQATLADVRSRGTLTEDDLSAALPESFFLLQDEVRMRAQAVMTSAERRHVHVVDHEEGRMSAMRRAGPSEAPARRWAA